MPFPLLPLTVAGLIAVAALKKDSKDAQFGMVTPQREVVYKTALDHLKDPNQLRTLADAFEKEGLKAHATVLRKRAALRELSSDTKKARKEVLRKALKSKDPVAVMKVSDAFRNEGATGAADKLAAYASGLMASQVAGESDGANG